MFQFKNLAVNFILLMLSQMNLK